MSTNDPQSNSDQYLFPTRQKINDEFPARFPDLGDVYVVNSTNFPVLAGVTCLIAEMKAKTQRLPHWHPNAAELGYVIEGEIEIMLWRSPGETTRCTLKAGDCWFFPQGSLHLINNVGAGLARVLVGLSNASPGDVDLPVAFNGLPPAVRFAVGRQPLVEWVGPAKNPTFGSAPSKPRQPDGQVTSPYGFELAAVTPLFDQPALGSVVWGVQDNWSILESISMLRAQLQPGTARDVIWYPDANTLYVVTKGRADFYLIQSGVEANPLAATVYDYVFVPEGVQHTFVNTGDGEFEVVAFFSNGNPRPEVSLSVATAFFPPALSTAALTQYYGQTATQPTLPLAELQNRTRTPYILKLPVA